MSFSIDKKVLSSAHSERPIKNKSLCSRSLHRLYEVWWWWQWRGARDVCLHLPIGPPRVIRAEIKTSLPSSLRYRLCMFDIRIFAEEVVVLFLNRSATAERHLPTLTLFFQFPWLSVLDKSGKERRADPNRRWHHCSRITSNFWRASLSILQKGHASAPPVLFCLPLRLSSFLLSSSSTRFFLPDSCLPISNFRKGIVFFFSSSCAQTARLKLQDSLQTTQNPSFLFAPFCFLLLYTSRSHPWNWSDLQEKTECGGIRERETRRNGFVRSRADASKTAWEPF